MKFRIFGLLAMAAMMTACGGDDKKSSDEKESTTNENGETNNAPKTAIVESAGGLKLAYVNLDSISEHFDGYVQLKLDLSALEVEMTKQLTQMENRIRNLGATIQNKQQSGVYTKSEMDGLMRSYQQSEANYGKKQQELQVEMQNTMGPVQQRIESLLLKVVDDYAAEKNLDFILVKGASALYAKPKYNVTANILTILNDSYQGGMDTLTLPAAVTNNAGGN